MRLLFPMLISLLLMVAPMGFQLIYTFGIQEPAPTAVAAKVDLSSYSRIDFQNNSLVGEIEFYPYSWIASEPETASEPVPFKTPGIWEGYPDGKGGVMGRNGYGSYRYLITGLRPGEQIIPSRSIDAPCRIYLNGRLCYRLGQPAKNEVRVISNLRDTFHDYIEVPATGEVEFVMEVGDSGTGGLSHIGLIYEFNAPILGLATRVYAPFVTGAIIAILAASVLFIRFSPRKKPALALIGIVLSVMTLYLFSRDSLIIGLDAFFSGALFGGLSIGGYALGAFFLLLYGMFGRNPVCNRYEFAALTTQLGLSFVFFVLGIGSAWSAIPLLFLVLVPMTMLILGLFHYAKGRGNLTLIIMPAAFASYGLVALLFSFDVLPISLMYHPTIFASSVAFLVFAAAFLDIYQHSIARRDNAILQRRYQAITNRSMAYLNNEQDILETLRWIGHSYEQSVPLGDKRLLESSSLMRRRLMALRETSIPLSVEAELESRLLEIYNQSHGLQTLLVLDIDEGKIQIPPLIFEGLIAEISGRIEETQAIVLSEYHRGVRITFPKTIVLSESVKSSIEERCRLIHLFVSFRDGSVFIFKGVNDER